MKIDIRPLGPELLDDYLNFFDNVAFTDHKEWSWCYCTYYHLGKQDEERIKSEHAGKFDKDVLRSVAIKLINERELNGYLAYADGQVIGWCNASNKNDYKKLCANKDIWNDGEDFPVKAITCFIVAPEARRKGVAAALLAYVTKDAAAQGYKVLEAYPANGELDCYAHFHGHEAMYIKNDFIKHKELKGYSVYRKLL